MTDTHDWSPQQITALKAVEDWFAAENAPRIFRLFGYAGTGKTTLALAIAKKVRAMVKEKDPDADLKGKVLFAAFTGKAASVLRQKGCHGASTIHGLIYKVDEETRSVPRFILNEDSALKGAVLCIIDECSMVGAELAHDLLSFGVKILVLGDPAQLPPVQDAGFFTNATPDVMLKDVHRQAEGNPIIRLSMAIRAGEAMQYGDHGALKVLPWKDGIDPAMVLGADQLLCGRNETRHRMNSRYRALRKFQRETPLIGEKLVCLKNNRSKRLLNGTLWNVAKLRKFNPAAVRMVLVPDDVEDGPGTEVKVNPLFFEGREAELTEEQRRESDDFHFGYALTVHKAQGSQWNNVMLFDESGIFRNDAQRWLYTGVTRAAQTLTVVM